MQSEGMNSGSMNTLAPNRLSRIARILSIDSTLNPKMSNLRKVTDPLSLRCTPRPPTLFCCSATLKTLQVIVVTSHFFPCLLSIVPELWDSVDS